MDSQFEDTWPDVSADSSSPMSAPSSYNTGLLIAVAVVVFVAWVVLAAYIAHGGKL